MATRTDNICLLYIQYIRRIYHQATVFLTAVVISHPLKTVLTSTSLSDGGMVTTLKKDNSLCNKANKERFIEMLSLKLKEAGYAVR